MKTILISAFLLVFSVSKSFSQQLKNDNSFAPSINGSFSGSGVNGNVRSSAIQPDGKIIIAGNFTTVDGVNRNCIARLLSNGNIDSTFVSSFESFNSNAFMDMTIQADGKIVVVGQVYPLGSVDLPSNSRSIIRLNTDGSLDQSFVITLPSGNFYGVEYLNSGKLIVSGSFTNVNGTAYNNLARLNDDGTLDFSFAMGTGPNSTVWDVKEEGAGKLLVAGSFTQYNGIPYGGFIRLDSAGTSDATFLSPGSNLFYSNDFRQIALQSSGKYILSGRVQTQSLDYQCVQRFNPNGTLDASFNPTGDFYQLAERCAVQSDDKIILGGDITSYNGQAVGHFLRLNTDGTIDMTFGATNMLDDAVTNIHVLQNDSIIITGWFEKFNYRDRRSFLKVGPNGQLAEDFPNVEGFNNSVTELKVLPDDKIITVGDFTYFENHPTNHIEKLTSNGEHDPGFISGSGFNGKVNTLYVQSDGKLIIGGEFTVYNGNSVNNLCRLNSDGSFDNTYAVTVNGRVNKIKSLPNGSYYLVGNFTNVNGVAQNGITRLTTSGGIDAGFNIGTGFDFEVYGLDINTLGQLVVFGDFSQFNGNSAFKAAFLDDMGSILPGTSASIGTAPASAHFQNDTSVIFGFSTYSMSAVYRMDFYGNVDPVFSDVFVPFSEKRLLNLSIQPDGKLLLQGRFSYMDQFSNWQDYSLIRTSADGALEYGFQTGYLGMVNTGDFQSNGKLVCGGSFSGIGVNNRNRIARIITCVGNSIDSISDSFSQPSDANSCNGNATITIHGTEPFDLNLDNGSILMQSPEYFMLQSLCPGIHVVSITNYCGDSLTSTIIIPVDSNYVFNNPFIDSLAIDSLGVTMTNCDIYYAGIDTAYIDSIWATGNTVNVIWNIVDSNGSNFDTTSYVLNNGNGVYWLQLSVFCPNKSLGEYFTVTEAIHFQNGHVGTVGLEDYKRKIFEIYPNPTNDQVHIGFSGFDAELTVYDVQGKVVLKDRIQNNGIVSLQNFERGVYLFDFKNSQGHSVQRVVKQ